MGEERTIVEVQPIIEVPQAVDNIPVNQVDQELPDTSEQQVEPHTSFKDIGATLKGLLKLKAHFDLELQQMDVKTTFLNGELEEEVYMNNLKDSPLVMVSGSEVCFIVLYVDDILLATNDKSLLYEVKQFLSKNFDMKDMGEASYVIGIKIHRDRFQVKGDGFNLDQCRKTADIAFAVGMLRRYQSNPDSDFAGCVDSRKSTSGYIFILAGGAISWKSIK
ncbi:hypothetical protein CK203_049225 [Vitis vinifera]|uniref:Reverse transcriptase Ty1/copia-type domain-containing protein n=1 Tax=Vitis vinifera TaxID=29760 RepID=A0A438GKP4_VITVI|nr:hypothetical protein CK203_049225 [Vitis vinifera]